MCDDTIRPDMSLFTVPFLFSLTPTNLPRDRLKVRWRVSMMSMVAFDRSAR